jgi:3-methyladenine DNA glycosylase AlkD
MNPVRKELLSLANKERAATSMRFFKTGQGQYGEGDIFLGITVPMQRDIARKHTNLPLPQVRELLYCQEHECRLTALLILVEQYTKNKDEKIVQLYLQNLSQVNNWDLVDSSAHYILGDHLLAKDRKIIYTLAKSKNMWKRRVAIIATLAFIRKKDFADTIAIAELLLEDSHDLIHKAVGWMLREMGKKDSRTLEKFLNTFSKKMPRTMLRYSIEKFPLEKRKHYMKLC